MLPGLLACLSLSLSCFRGDAVLDLKQIRQQLDATQAALSRRGDYDLEPLRQLDQQQRQLEGQRSPLQTRQQ
jgi:seryl-tRNA synthetase